MGKVTEVTRLEDQRKVGIKLRLNRKFDEFTQKDQDTFLHDFSDVLNVSASDITNVRFRAGCVIFEGHVPESIWLKLKLLYDEADSSGERDLTADELRFRAFLERYAVASVGKQEPFKFHIRATPKTAPDTRDHVILIHGWNGTGASFGKLPVFLSERTGCRVMVYEYPTVARRKRSAVPFLAQDLDRWVRAEAPAARNFAFVAHSLGGLLVRRFVFDQLKYGNAAPLHSRIKLISLVATPDEGGTLAAMMKRILRVDLSRELSSDAEFLRELDSVWHTWVQKNVPRKCRLRIVLGVKDLSNAEDKASATQLDPNATVILQKGSRSILEPKSSRDPIVNTLVQFAEEAKIGHFNPVGAVQQTA